MQYTALRDRLYIIYTCIGACRGNRLFYSLSGDRGWWGFFFIKILSAANL